MPLETITALKCNKCRKLVDQKTGDYYVIQNIKIDHYKTTYRSKESFATTIINNTEPTVLCSSGCMHSLICDDAVESDKQ